MEGMNTEILHNFIVLEGLDGSGTSTQLSLLEKRLHDKKIPHITTFEPTDTPVGIMIRDVLHGNITLHPATLAHLYVSDRHEHLYAQGGIIESLHAGNFVISDRYIFSSLAYQSIDCGFEYVQKINGIFPLPELLIFIDLPPEICQNRIASRGKTELFDSLEFQKQVYSGYRRALSIFRESKMKIVYVDGTLPPEEVMEKIWEIFIKLSIL